MVDASQTVVLVVVVIALLAGVIGLFLYLSHRLKRRRDQILTELKDKPELVQDRAFNRLTMARREVAVVARTGADTSRAQELIAQSQSAFDLRQFPRAYELAQSAHESLVSVRSRPPSNTSPPNSAARPDGPVRRVPAVTAAPSPVEAPPPASPLARNRAESHFQLGLLAQDLETAHREHPTAGGTLEADSLRNQAQAAFDRADYTEAFRLALRARRGLGGRVESLAPAPAARPASSPASGYDPEGAAEQVASAERCPNCGYPTLPSDQFCRGCGTPRRSTVCPTCGTERGATDTFCGKCGTRFSS